MNTSNSQSVIISLIVVILCCLVATAKAEPRQACSAASGIAKATKAPAPQPQKKNQRPVTAVASSNALGELPPKTTAVIPARNDVTMATNTMDTGHIVWGSMRSH